MREVYVWHNQASKSSISPVFLFSGTPIFSKPSFLFITYYYIFIILVVQTSVEGKQSRLAINYYPSVTAASPPQSVRDTCVKQTSHGSRTSPHLTKFAYAAPTTYTVLLKSSTAVCCLISIPLVYQSSSYISPLVPSREYEG